MFDVQELQHSTRSFLANQLNQTQETYTEALIRQDWTGLAELMSLSPAVSADLVSLDEGLRFAPLILCTYKTMYTYNISIHVKFNQACI